MAMHNAVKKVQQQGRYLKLHFTKLKVSILELEYLKYAAHPKKEGSCLPFLVL